MDKLKLLSTIFSKLGSLTKKNGQIIVTRDSKSLYVDLEGERIEITDWIDIDTEETLLAILTPLTNKYYYTKDSNKIWRYIGGEWKCLNDSADDLAPTYTESSTLLKLSSGEKLSVAFGKISKAITDLISHIGDSVKHITSTERTNWNNAKLHADSAHARIDATKVEKSSTNGNIKINGTETTVYTHPGGTNPHGTTKSDVGLGNVGNFKAVSTVANQGLTETEKSNARANIGAGTSSFSGSYNDLTNKPTIPTNNNQLTNGAGYITSSGTAKTISDTLPISKGGTGKTTAKAAEYNILSDMTESTDNPNDDSLITYTYVNPSETQGKLYWRKASTLWNYIKSKLATVATSGSYNDLSNKPTIPTVGNGTVTIKQAGASKGTFTMNQSGNTTIELTDNNTTYGVATQSTNGLESAADKKKLDGIATGAEVNQNAFSNVVVGSTTIAADSKTDTLTLAGSNVTITPDATNDKVTIGITKANVTTALGYTPPTTNTTYGVATSSVLGLVKSGTDITVDSSGNVSVNDDSHNHIISNVDGLQNALDGKLSKTTYEYNKELALGSSGKVCIGVFPCYDSNISVEIKSTTNTTYNGTLVIATQNINTTGGGVYTATVFGDEKNTLTSAIKIQYTSGSNAFSVYINLPSWSKNLLHIQCVSLAGTPSSIATRVDSIPSTATIVPTNAFTHTHNYAGSSSSGGSATSAVKLDSSAGSATQPVYFSGGKPVACTYTLGKSVPSDAKFTDTNTWRGIQNNLTSDSTTDSLSAAQGKVLKGLVDGKAASSHTHNYAGSSSAGGAANSLAGFTNTTTTGTAINNATQNGHVYVNDTSGIGFSNDGACYVQAYSTSWVHQIYGDYITGQIAVRGKNNGTWQAWRKVLDSSNYKSYCTPANIGAATASHTHSNYLTGITKDMVTTALGYTPPTKDTNTWRPLGTTADTACAGNDSRLSNARPASDVYAWAKASSKPSYSWSEITNKPSSFTPASHNHELIIDSNNKDTPIYITYSKDELAYDEFTYLTAWYGYELRKIPKTLFATASHTHSYLPLSGGTVSGTITADNLQSKNGLTLTNTYSTADASIKCYWKDNSLHEIVTRNSNGLSSYFGWAGSSSYSTTTWLRGQTCKYQNSSGTATISDVRMKKDFRGLDVYDKFFDAIEPCAFRMTNGSSGRYHIGYKAQQIEQALIDSGLTTQDFAGFIRMPYTIDKEDINGTKAHEEAGIKEGDDELSIIYTEFAAMNTYQIQKCKKEISNLKNEIAELKNIISKLNA